MDHMQNLQSLDKTESGPVALIILPQTMIEKIAPPFFF